MLTRKLPTKGYAQVGVMSGCYFQEFFVEDARANRNQLDRVPRDVPVEMGFPLPCVLNGVMLGAEPNHIERFGVIVMVAEGIRRTAIPAWLA